MGQIKALNDLKPHDKGKIIKITGRGPLKRRLLDMGIIPGSELEIVRVAPLGYPVEIIIKRYNLSLRKEEAKQVLIEIL